MDLNKVGSDFLDESFIKKVLKEKYGEGVQMKSFQVRPGSEKGDNYAGDLIAVDVEVVVPPNGTDSKNLCWMVKTLKPGPENDKPSMTELLGFFDREESFYTKFMSDLDKHVKKDALKIAPLVYTTNENKKGILVLEHLKPLGFRDPINKKNGFDLEHIKHSLNWLARLHAASHVLFSKYPGGREAWSRDNSVISEPINFSRFKDMAHSITKHYLNNFELLRNGSEDDEIIRVFESKFKKAFGEENVFKKIESNIYIPRSEFKVLCHGDTWFNNMMFKYDENDKILDTIFLDMQMIYLGNIGSDLGYFLCSCVTYESLSKNLDEYLSYYYIRLSAHLSELDPSMMKLPLSLEDVKRDFLNSSIIGLIISFNVFPLILPEKDQAWDLEFNKLDFDSKEDVQQMAEYFSQHSANIIFKDKRLRSRMIGVFKFLLEIDAFDYLK